jgi:hypothetical protein
MEGVYKALFKMSKQVTSLEAKVDGLQGNSEFSAMDDKLGHLVSRMDLVIKRVDDKIDDQGLGFDSMKRAMERLRESNDREDEAVRDINRKLERFDLVLRRILGFNQTFEKLSDKLTEMDQMVYDLHGLGFPKEEENESSQDDSDETQYDNEVESNEQLGRSPPPTLFSASESIPSFSPSVVPTVIPVSTVPSDSVSDVTVPDVSEPVPTSIAPSDSAPEVSDPEISEPDPTSTVPSKLDPAVSVPDRSPDITMTSPTPLNSQDVDQTTTVITSGTNLLPPPANVPTSSEPSPTTNAAIPKAKHRTPTLTVDAAETRRSARIRLNSRDPSPEPVAAKRRSEDDEGGDPKRRRVVPS